LASQKSAGDLPLAADGNVTGQESLSSVRQDLNELKMQVEIFSKIAALGVANEMSKGDGRDVDEGKHQVYALSKMVANLRSGLDYMNERLNGLEGEVRKVQGYPGRSSQTESSAKAVRNLVYITLPKVLQMMTAFNVDIRALKATSQKEGDVKVSDFSNVARELSSVKAEQTEVKNALANMEKQLISSNTNYQRDSSQQPEPETMARIQKVEEDSILDKFPRQPKQMQQQQYQCEICRESEARLLGVIEDKCTTRIDKLAAGLKERPPPPPRPLGNETGQNSAVGDRSLIDLVDDMSRQHSGLEQRLVSMEDKGQRHGGAIDQIGAAQNKLEGDGRNRLEQLHQMVAYMEKEIEVIKEENTLRKQTDAAFKQMASDLRQVLARIGNLSEVGISNDLAKLPMLFESEYRLQNATRRNENELVSLSSAIKQLQSDSKDLINLNRERPIARTLDNLIQAVAQVGRTVETVPQAMNRQHQSEIDELRKQLIAIGDRVKEAQGRIDSLQYMKGDLGALAELVTAVRSGQETEQTKIKHDLRQFQTFTEGVAQEQSNLRQRYHELSEQTSAYAGIKNSLSNVTRVVEDLQRETSQLMSSSQNSSGSSRGLSRTVANLTSIVMAMDSGLEQMERSLPESRVVGDEELISTLREQVRSLAARVQHMQSEEEGHVKTGDYKNVVSGIAAVQSDINSLASNFSQYASEDRSVAIRNSVVDMLKVKGSLESEVGRMREHMFSMEAESKREVEAAAAGMHSLKDGLRGLTTVVGKLNSDIESNGKMGELVARDVLRRVEEKWIRDLETNVRDLSHVAKEEMGLLGQQFGKLRTDMEHSFADEAKSLNMMTNNLRLLDSRQENATGHVGRLEYNLNFLDQRQRDLEAYTASSPSSNDGEKEAIRLGLENLGSVVTDLRDKLSDQSLRLDATIKKRDVEAEIDIVRRNLSHTNSSLEVRLQMLEKNAINGGVNSSAASFSGGAISKVEMERLNRAIAALEENQMEAARSDKETKLPMLFESEYRLQNATRRNENKLVSLSLAIKQLQSDSRDLINLNRERPIAKTLDNLVQAIAQVGQTVETVPQAMNRQHQSEMDELRKQLIAIGDRVKEAQSRIDNLQYMKGDLGALAESVTAVRSGQETEQTKMKHDLRQLQTFTEGIAQEQSNLRLRYHELSKQSSAYAGIKNSLFNVTRVVEDLQKETSQLMSSSQNSSGSNRGLTLTVANLTSIVMAMDSVLEQMEKSLPASRVVGNEKLILTLREQVRSLAARVQHMQSKGEGHIKTGDYKNVVSGIAAVQLNINSLATNFSRYASEDRSVAIRNSVIDMLKVKGSLELEVGRMREHMFAMEAESKKEIEAAAARMHSLKDGLRGLTTVVGKLNSDIESNGKMGELVTRDVLRRVEEKWIRDLETNVRDLSHVAKEEMGLLGQQFGTLKMEMEREFADEAKTLKAMTNDLRLLDSRQENATGHVGRLESNLNFLDRRQNDLEAYAASSPSSNDVEKEAIRSGLDQLGSVVTDLREKVSQQSLRLDATLKKSNIEAKKDVLMSDLSLANSSLEVRLQTLEKNARSGGVINSAASYGGAGIPKEEMERLNRAIAALEERQMEAARSGKEASAEEK
jgi:gas vesicle protein